MGCRRSTLGLFAVNPTVTQTRLLICHIHYYYFKKCFSVPTDPVMRKKWMSTIPRVLNLTKEDLEGANVSLCSRHFLEKCFVRKNGLIISLKTDSVPSIFYIPTKTSDVCMIWTCLLTL